MGGMVRQDLSVLGMELCEGSDKQVLPGGVGVGDGMDVCGALRGVMLRSWGDGGEDEVSM